MSVCLWTYFCQHVSSTTVTKLNMCVVETKMKAESENGCGPTNDSCSNDY